MYSYINTRSLAIPTKLTSNLISSIIYMFSFSLWSDHPSKKLEKGNIIMIQTYYLMFWQWMCRKLMLSFKLNTVLDHYFIIIIIIKEVATASQMPFSRILTNRNLGKTNNPIKTPNWKVHSILTKDSVEREDTFFITFFITKFPANRPFIEKQTDFHFRPYHCNPWHIGF